MKKTWTQELTQELNAAVEGLSQPIPLSTVSEIAQRLELTDRRIASKLRKMGFAVELVSARPKTFTEDEARALADFVTANKGDLTFAELAAAFAGGKFTAKQIQGKLLALELHGYVKPSAPRLATKTYSEAEEAKFVEMANSGKSIEAIAMSLDRPLNSIRGKALSLLSKQLISAIPHQEHYSDTAVDALADIDVANLSVEEIAEKTGHTLRGVKTMLTRRKLDCADYKGSARSAKAAAQRQAALAA